MLGSSAQRAAQSSRRKHCGRMARQATMASSGRKLTATPRGGVDKSNEITPATRQKPGERRDRRKARWVFKGCRANDPSKRLDGMVSSRIRYRNLELQKECFCIGIILLFAQVKNLSFPPIPGLHLDQLIEPRITHHSRATTVKLKSSMALTSPVHTPVSIIDYRSLHR